jgi:hypothetical protein
MKNQVKIRKGKTWGEGAGNQPVNLIQFSDTFDRVDQPLYGNDTETGEQKWFGVATTSTSTLKIVSGELPGNSSGMAFVVSKMLDDCRARFLVRGAWAFGRDFRGIIRAKSSANYYAVRILSTGGWIVSKLVDGTETTLASGYTGGSDEDIVIQVVGSVIKVFDDNTEVFSVTDSTYDEGLIGILVSNANVVLTSIEGWEL